MCNITIILNWYQFYF